MKDVNCIKCGAPAAFPKAVKEPYICVECQAANKAFLEKIKTVNIGTGSKTEKPTCAECGNPIEDHMVVGPFPLSMLRKKPRHNSDEESSFAA